MSATSFDRYVEQQEQNPEVKRALDEARAHFAAGDEYDDEVCQGYPEHDYELFDETDGIRTYHCRRCGAEISEDDGDA